MRMALTALRRFLTVGAAAALLAVVPLSATASAAPDATPRHQSQVTLTGAADGTPAGAVQWYQANMGSSGYEGYCEMAAENSYGTTGVWPSAIDHWYGAVDAGKAHSGDPNPPLGAFVYWDISAPYGHVGISDGAGGFYSSSIGGAIGHQSSVYYFSNYLGWSDPQVPHGLTTVANQH
ncbi:MAG: CHAP domain-containing protein [Actinocatenispora sp.]